MSYKITIITLLMSLMALCGCGGANVSGKVTFEDGSPLTAGTVNFETDRNSMIGHIQSNGTYVLSGDGGTRGIPTGSYKVFISNATEDTDEVVPDRGRVKSGGRKMQKQLVDTKFLSPTTSGLTCDVQGSMTYDIKVAPPAN